MFAYCFIPGRPASSSRPRNGAARGGGERVAHALLGQLALVEAKRAVVVDVLHERPVGVGEAARLPHDERRREMQ
jgi:hypothetical protein